MKKVTLKTEKVLAAFNVVGTAKYSNLEDSDKIKVWKITRLMKPVADKFREDSEDAAQKMKPTEDFDERLQKAQEFERLSRSKYSSALKLPMGAAEYGEFLKELQKYKKTVNDAMKEFADKEVELEFEPLSEDAFVKLMSSNDWTMEQVTMLGDIICE